MTAVNEQEKMRFSIARAVARARKERGWTLREVADAAGVADRTVYAVEAARGVNTAKLLAVAEALGLRVGIEKAA